MMSAARLAFLGRLARRYALRHKGQTARAILGLLIATTVLATGLGLGESIGTSLEQAALAQFGPIDVTLSAQQPFDASIADTLAESAGLPGVQGAATLRLTGAVSNPRSGLAEAIASVRGVSAQEAAALGPLREPDADGIVPEPGPGETVLSEGLAERLDARIGDTVVLRVQRAEAAAGADLETFNVTGVAGVPGRVAEHPFSIRENAFGVGAQAFWQGEATVRVVLRSPGGVEFANESGAAPVTLLVPGPIEVGGWTMRIESATPVLYTAGAGAAYPEGVLGGSTVVLEARVVAVADDEGRAAITRRPVALVPLEDLQGAVGAEGRATAAYYRVAGDPYAARDALEEALSPDVRERFDIRAEKADALENAREAGAEITGFLLVMGGFTVVASVLLAFTLFSALVEERRAELGIARALGLTRGEVALSMTMEGAIYAFGAALAGLALGLALLWGLMIGIGRAAAAQGAPELGVHLSALTIATALAVGTLLPLITIGIASLRFARLDPARAIRGVPDDPRGRRRLGLVMAAALLLLGALLSVGEVGRLVGIPTLAAGLAVALRAVGWPKLALVAAAGGFAHVAWSLYSFTAFPQDAGELDPIMTLSRGAVLALGFAALAVASAAPYEAMLRAVGRRGGRALSAFVAVRYLVARRRPVGLTMAMIALVVVIVTVMGTLFVTFGATLTRDEGGYEVLGEAAVAHDGFPQALPPDLQTHVERADFLPRHVEFQQANVTRGSERVEVHFGVRQFLGVTDGFAEFNEYSLGHRAPAYATDRDAWRAVARGEAILLPDWALEGNNFTAGESLTISTAAFGPRTYVLGGGVESQFVFQTFFPAADVRAMGFPTGTQVFLRTTPEGDPSLVAHRLADLFADEGLSFTSVPEEVAQIEANLQALVLVFEAFLALGLFVGLAATGFLASRAVHERMREIGTLRALGFEEADVKRAFVLESTTTAAVGLLLGTLAGLLVAHSVWWRELRADGETSFRPPWLILLGFFAAVLLLAALAARGPAKRASKLAPAIAVRHVE